MRPIDALPTTEAHAVRGLLFDLDDTLLDHGRLTRVAYDALWQLSEASLLLVGVTGRPSGWGAVLARQWPVDGIVTENGALTASVVDGRLSLDDALDAATRRTRREALRSVVDRLRQRLPDLKPADDVEARASDFTFDIGEHERVPPDRIAEAVSLARSFGARVFRSSVHLHVTLDSEDKATGTLRFLTRRFGLDATACRSAFAYIGDSQNDESCFAAFRTTLAVSNFSGRPSVAPRFITRAPRGAGFAEAARALLTKRGQKAGKSVKERP